MNQNSQDWPVNLFITSVAFLTCLGVVSTVLLISARRELAENRATIEEQAAVINTLSAEVFDKRDKIKQANRLLSIAYPEAKIDFLAE